MLSTLHRLRSFEVPCQQFNKLFQQLELRTLPSVVTKKIVEIGLSINCYFGDREFGTVRWMCRVGGSAQ
jgi:hypothetical protein